MKKLFTLLFTSFILSNSFCQTLAEWNFNSVPPDANLSTGSTTVSTGTGTITNIGGIAGSFSTGAVSTDPAPAADNTGLQTTAYPAATLNNKTAGIEISVNTTGFQSIVLKFDLRLSNTAANTYTIQYSTNGTTFIDFATLVPPVNGTTPAFNNNNTYNFSSITALNNNTNAKFRIVSTFAGAGTTYVGNSGAYGTTGTVRFDMVNVTPLSVLPVSISSFTGSYTNKTSLLKWTVGNEINISKYAIERSEDGRIFNETGFVNATGSTEYSYTDASAKTAVNFYRLRIVGSNETKYSAVVKILSDVFNLKLNVYPSPAANSINAEFASDNKAMANVQMTDVSGRIVLQKNTMVQQGYNNLNFDIGTLNKGMYIFKITIAGKVTSTVINKL